MDLVGCHTSSVLSISPSSIQSTGFALLDAHGDVSLWDTRLRPGHRRYVTIPSHHRAKGCSPAASPAASSSVLARQDAADGCATEAMYVPEHNAVVVLRESLIQVFDVRKHLHVMTEYAHSDDVEVTGFLQRPYFVPPGARTTLVVDAHGCVMPFDVVSGRPAHTIESYVFGKKMDLGAACGFGELGTMCSGFGIVQTGGGDGTSHPSEAVLFCIDMDGDGVIYRSDLRGSAFSLKDSDVAGAQWAGSSSSGQVFNPPFVNCCCYADACDGVSSMSDCNSSSSIIALGRGDGRYDIVALDGIHVIPCMTAPGHASNSLTYVDWTQPGKLLTLSLCGELTVWSVDTFLSANADADGDGEGEGEESGDLPDVVAAESHRDVAPRKGQINCAVRTREDGGDGVYFIGDSAGCITSYRAELA